jgi:UbiD family decarboxylase
LLDVQVETSERVKQRVKPVLVPRAEAPVKQNVITGDEADFLNLPAYIGHEKDARPGSLTGIVVIRDPDTKRYNISWHVDHILDSKRTTMALDSGERHSWDIITKLRKQGKKEVPVAQVFGHHVLFGLAAAVRVGLDMDEFDLAGSFLGEPLRLVPSETWGEDLLIPADAEVVIEGTVSTEERTHGGLWCDFLRYYIPDSDEPVFHLKAINMRENPIMEHNWVGQYVYSDIAICSFLRSMLAARFPGVKAVNYIAPTILVIQFKPGRAGDVRRLAGMAHGYGAFVKHVIVVDEDVDPFDPGMVLWSIGTRVDASKKAYIVNDLSPLGIDPSAEEALHSGETIGGLVIDSTKPINKPFAEVGYPSQDVLKRIHAGDYLSREEIGRLTTGQTTRPWAKL